MKENNKDKETKKKTTKETNKSKTSQKKKVNNKAKKDNTINTKKEKKDNKKETNTRRSSKYIEESQSKTPRRSSKYEEYEINNKKKIEKNTSSENNQDILKELEELKKKNNLKREKLKQEEDKEKELLKEEEKIEQPKKIKKVKRKIRWLNIIILLFAVISLIVLIISLKEIFTWQEENTETTKQLEVIEEIAEVETVEDNENTIIIEQVKEIPKANPYWDYIKMDLINVDFTELKKKNSQTVGWIQVSGTNINYPFVQAKDNDFYLDHSFDKTYNKAGWVFLDYRNNSNYTDKNTIIYAHSRLNNTMFGTLKKTLKKDWLNNTNNHVVKISTETENTLWQVFSVYHIPETSDYIKFNFSTNQEFTKFTNMLIKRSIHNFNTTVNENDKIITLSTCYGDDERMVLHAKLIKKEAK